MRMRKNQKAYSPPLLPTHNTHSRSSTTFIYLPLASSLRLSQHTPQRHKLKLHMLTRHTHTHRSQQHTRHTTRTRSNTTIRL